MRNSTIHSGGSHGSNEGRHDRFESVGPSKETAALNESAQVTRRKRRNQIREPSIERVYGFEQDELVGTTVHNYFYPDDRKEVLEAFQAVVSSAGYTVKAVEYRHRKADGTYMWVESVASNGTGLKLVIVQRAAESHRWDLRVRGVRWRGTLRNHRCRVLGMIGVISI